MSANQLWRWRALTDEGELQSGALWAADREAAYLLLAGKALHPLSLIRCTRRHRWQRRHCYELFRQLATLLQAGLTLSHSLHMLAQQHPQLHWQALLQSLADNLSEGIAFSEALKKWPRLFSPLHIAMVKTGELTGQLETCCRQLAQQQKAQQELNAKVARALRYPAIVLLLAAAVVVAMVTLVLPEFAAIYKTFNTPLPLLTRMVMALADAVRDWAIVAFAFPAIGIAIGWRLRRYPFWQRLGYRLLLRLPVTGTLMKGQKLGQIFTVLALTQQAGIVFLQGLESTGETVETPFWRDVLKAIRLNIEQGAPVWSAFRDAAVFTPLCIQLLRTGEMSGSLDIMLANLAHYHSGQTLQLADSLAALLEPLLLIVTGVIIGTLVVAMYLPIFHLGDAMSAG